MEIKKDPMERVKMLPENFDGVVRFTNPFDEDFVAKYDSQEYTIPAHSTVALTPLMLNFTPIQLLNICKKFALDLATREFLKSEWYQQQLKRERNADGSPRSQWSFSGASTYEMGQLAPYIEKCLYVYPTGKAKVTTSLRPKLEENLSRDPKGRLNTIPLEEGMPMNDAVDSFAKTK